MIDVMKSYEELINKLSSIENKIVSIDNEIIEINNKISDNNRKFTEYIINGDEKSILISKENRELIHSLEEKKIEKINFKDIKINLLNSEKIINLKNKVFDEFLEKSNLLNFENEKYVAEIKELYDKIIEIKESINNNNLEIDFLIEDEKKIKALWGHRKQNSNIRKSIYFVDSLEEYQYKINLKKECKVMNDRENKIFKKRKELLSKILPPEPKKEKVG